MVDHCKRKITYLRISITDRCNLRCVYCMPANGLGLLEHSDILSYKEILRVIHVSAEMGITKVRVTGGEPLLRRDVCHLLRDILNVPGIRDLGLTTNGVLLKSMARPLWEAGLRRINISLDTLNPLKFRKIARRDHYQEVWEGIREAESVGFNPIRINVVAVKGLNDDELGCFARLSIEKPYSFRFIEYMPMGSMNWDFAKFMSCNEIVEKLKIYGSLHPIPRHCSDGPCRRFRFAGALGEIGLISPISNHFCGTCNRLRLTANGKLRPCLMSDHEVDIMKPLREQCSDGELATLIQEAITKKPKRHEANDGSRQHSMRHMSRIGG
ncbi:MAG: GTP 3',8-cyclase MoaA [Desulfomonile tiedjei]|uniref:GTP 3',8-cyclase n=1 Tax=Desulfomonile tiedjei TaxID=2358 RepID=A0A9D6UXM6_9BACT|nr:GTP 3',8-cyclase MoaA [Desulfomonile tiedjei]